jgi:N-6 DNA Methylase
MLEPYQGRVYDPCCGSGGFFVQSERFIEEHGGRIGQISIFGQESNPTTWRLSAMNLAIRGLDYNLGKEPANTFTHDLHPDLRADTVMANPPFNMKEWWDGKLEGDARWAYGTPPKGNANFAWVQHALPPRCERQHGPAARQRLDELEQRRGKARSARAWSRPIWWNAWWRCRASCSPTRRYRPVRVATVNDEQAFTVV